MELVRYLAAVWSLVVAALMIGEYVVPSDIMSIVAAAIPVLGAIGVGVWMKYVGDERFKLLSKNVVVVLAFAALLVPVYMLCKGLMQLGSELSIAIYVMFALLAVALMDVEDIPVLENEPSTVRGFFVGGAVGALLAAVAYYLYYNVFGGAALIRVLIGYIPYQIYEMFSRYLAVFLIMLFVVAVPEELFFRVYLYKTGRFAVTTVPAAIVSGAAWFALHAVTRAPDYAALLVLGIVGAVLYAIYGLYGLVGAVATHAVYNTCIALLSELGFEYGFVAAVVLFIVFAAVGVLVKKEKVRYPVS